MILKQVIQYDNAPIIEVTWVDENDVVVKCHAYGVAEFDQLREELGDDAPTYQEMMDEIAATYVPPPPPPIYVPPSVTPRQARLALLGAGLLAQVDAAIASMEEPQRSAVQIEWEYATAVERASPWVAGLGSALGLDDAALDQLFITAATL